MMQNVNSCRDKLYPAPEKSGDDDQAMPVRRVAISQTSLPGGFQPSTLLSLVDLT